MFFRDPAALSDEGIIRVAGARLHAVRILEAAEYGATNFLRISAIRKE